MTGWRTMLNIMYLPLNPEKIALQATFEIFNLSIEVS